MKTHEYAFARVSEFLTRHGLGRMALADMAGVDRGFVVDLERGQGSLSRIQKVEAFMVQVDRDPSVLDRYRPEGQGAGGVGDGPQAADPAPDDRSAA